ncbi:tRNA preQ1(34) S-adenosylmethionine ribosyltransferase-isomerase QueA [Porphyromonas sp. COT-239 OH1446]|uniref:tRNA preQ1(34) S-adenosylmethionine ribosyltransferase-isomerase QueA n=1 Tax=Porphyromonas sp. COT-239 OH1446 TaxID=1515613 RepID=UPI00052CA445|nr:tRNA preQ1(34) S-adenosylmethionine ribosyltransferase-isomerase QueA [Porphyromonas sp. COT-239 OH1446]KGN69331.1 S-adenosylmethionine tRNA ribosyltransferase [Porphyromonas sp. COT-239 OH1446]
MKLSQFKLDIPEALIAKKPAYFRDESRMMVLNKTTGEIEHRIFKEILDYFGKDDVFVFNNTRVFPARLYGNKEKTGAQIEVFLLRELNSQFKLWDVLVDPARKIRIGNKLYFGQDDNLVAEVIDNTTSRGRTLRFLFDGTHEEFKRTLFSLGETPLPKYMERSPTAEDAERYQSLFATEEGAVVAPAASLHFSRELLKRMEIRDIRKAYLTVHNGLGNYRDIDVEDLTKHKMESEQMIVGREACQIVNEAKTHDHKICVVGTSALRAMETASSTEHRLKEYDGWTNRFIFPPYDFAIPTSLVTNLHMSKSTLLMMTAAFGGYDHVMNAYAVAIKEKYRFGAYGDAMLII